MSCPGAGRARHAVVEEADRRAASTRSRNTAAMAVTRAAPTAIRMICQPGMPPTVTTGAAGAGTGASGAPPGGSRTRSCAEAAGTTADASRAQVTAARAAASRRGRAAACRAAVRS